jgi:hypothetical protein
LEEDTALERFGVAEGGDLDVEAGSRLHEGGDVGGDHHHGDVLGGDRRRGHGQVEALQQVGQRLLPEDRILVAVPGQTDHQPVADQLVVPRPGDRDQVAYPDATRRPHGEGVEEEDRHEELEKSGHGRREGGGFRTG